MSSYDPDLWEDILTKYYLKDLMERSDRRIDGKHGIFLKKDDSYEATAGFRLVGYTTGLERPALIILFSTFASGCSEVLIENTIRKITEDVKGQYGGYDQVAVFNIWHIGKEVCLGLPSKFRSRPTRIGSLASNGIAKYCNYVMEEFNARRERAKWAMTAQWIQGLGST
ncbi:hypothetical protein QBC46DRAFT_348207 [Diplogelasinospora grovesii]|uniref:Uncharacterized protein n=1 Tax=Diplogelasinospora grovesii TaxID=303347 RepID=A0AAN6RYJ1_9PEZI|nr:hypothetical protein QBC46DRAFT_348207 [Diplogelasinospora grovesii]